MFRADNNNKIEDFIYILNHLRQEDLLEVQTIWGENWREKTFENLKDSEMIIGRTKNNNIPAVVGGYTKLDIDAEGVGCVWLLSTDLAAKHYFSLLREIKKEFQKIDELFWLTYNFIHKGNYQAKNWLKWLGYKFDNPKPEGMNIPDDFEFFYRIRPIKGLGE